MDGEDIKNALLLIGIGAGIVIGGWLILSFIWWVWATTMTWFLGIFNIEIGFWELLALLFFWIFFLFGFKVGSLINFTYKKKMG